MGFSFHEKMQGTLEDAWGNTHRCAFQLRAEASALGQFLWDGEARLTGLVTCLPWCEDAAAEGTLDISPLRQRRIGYKLKLTAKDGATYHLEGMKRLRLFEPLRSMTEMPVTLVGKSGALARGAMHFDLNTLLPFVGSASLNASFRGLAAKGQRPPVAPRLDSPISFEHEEALARVARALISSAHGVPPVDEQTLRGARRMLRGMPHHLIRVFRAGLHALDVYARARYGKSFATIDDAQRARLLDTLLQPKPDSKRQLIAARFVHALAMPVLAAHFDRADYLDHVGFEFRGPANTERPRHLDAVITPEDLGAHEEMEADVVIVGSGAGAGPIAAVLAEAGYGVAVVEEGRYVHRDAFAGSPLARVERFWRQAGMTASVGSPPISIPLGRVVGGTTAINSGTCFRTPSSVLEQWRHEFGLPDAFSPAGMEPHFAATEAELQVASADPKHLGPIARMVAKGADAMGLEHGPLARNAPACDGQGACIFGCPTDAKRSTNVSYIPRAMRAGAAVMTGLPVTQILVQGRRAVGVEARGADAHGRPHRLRIRARAVVVACGTIGTPMLLWASGIDHPLIGKNLSVHPALGMWALCPDRMDHWRAIPQGYSVREKSNDGIFFEGYYIPPQIAGATAMMSGERLAQWLGEHARVAQFGFMVRDESRGHLTRTPWGPPIIRYDLSERSVTRLKKGASLLAELYLRGGAERVHAGIAGVDDLTTLAQARALADTSVDALAFNLLGSHPLGTCRMAADSTRGVVDPNHCVFGYENLYVVDGSAVPTSLGVNPQVTIMAMAHRAAGELAQRHAL